MVTAALAATVTAARQSSPAPQTPVFTSGVDLVQLDVSVLDKDRQPVRGLTQADFTILEDGKPQKVAAFSAVDLPDVVRSATKWIRDVAPDVTTNEIDNHRIFVLVLDDATMPMDLWAIEATRRSAESFIDRMGPDDLAAVIFTMDNRGAQDLSSDHAKLKKAVNTLSRLGNVPLIVPRETKGPAQPPMVPLPACWVYVSSMQVVQRATEYLAALPQRRKTLVYLSGGMAVDVGARKVVGPLIPIDEASRKTCGADVVYAMSEAFRNAQRANVNIYGMDPMGLRTDARLGSPSGAAIEFLQTVSENTGGHAIINTNDLEPGLTQIFRENGSYYLLGYQPSNVKADGTFRRIDVKVNRPDVEVRARKNYYAPKPVNAKAPPPSPAVAAIADILPKSDLPLRITLAPFARPGEPTSTVTIALGLRRPALTERVTEEVDWLVRAFTPEGDARGSADQTTALILPVARRGSDISRFDLLARMDLKPGRYQLRISAHSTTLDTRGSVYADVEVPDFDKEPLTLSGVLMSVLPGEPIAPAEALSGVVPVIPTTEREFTRFERASAFLRVYQGGKEGPAPVSLAIRIVDGNDRTMVSQSEVLAPDRFATARAADERFTLPLTQLPPGGYLLTLDATMGKATARRDVRFNVK
jgi:VWFA-related protein